MPEKNCSNPKIKGAKNLYPSDSEGESHEVKPTSYVKKTKTVRSKKSAKKIKSNQKLISEEGKVVSICTKTDKKEKGSKVKSGLIQTELTEFVAGKKRGVDDTSFESNNGLATQKMKV